MRKYVMIMLIGLFSIALKAEVWTVDTTGVEGDSLQIAVDNAWADPGIDTVLLENGTYHLFINDTLGLIMHDSVVLMSQNGADACTLTAQLEYSSDRAWHVIFCEFGDSGSHAAMIKALTITRGRAFGDSIHSYGSGIYCYQSSPTIDSCVIQDNSAWHDGGGLYINYSSSTLTGNIISNNNGYDYGGGVCMSGHSSATLTGNTISDNGGEYGGGVAISDTSSPILTNNEIADNSAVYGGGFYIGAASQPVLTNNTIKDNETSSSSWGGGFYIVSSSPILTGNTISNNSSSHGAGLLIDSYASPMLTDNIIANNSAQNGGGLFIGYHCSPTFTGNTISDNNATSVGGGLLISGYAFVELTKCVIVGNIANGDGGAIFDEWYSKVTIDSCLIIDNGNTLNNISGLAYLASDTDTFEISYSNIYYNTCQLDTEIVNAATLTMPLGNNFWWDTTEAGISALIDGPNDHSNWFNDFIPGVPGEPLSVDSVRNYTDTTYSTICDYINHPDTLYLRMYGQDRNVSMQEAAVAILKSSVYPEGIAVGLVETDTNSGIYQGEAYVLVSMGDDTIRVDDIYQRIKVDSLVDTITVYANTDTSKKWIIGSNQTGIVEHRVESNYLVEIIPDILIEYTVIRYQLPEAIQVKIEVFDLTGRCVRTLVDRPHERGSYHITWYGENDQSKKLPAGIYFCRVKTGRFESIKKTVIIR